MFLWIWYHFEFSSRFKIFFFSWLARATPCSRQWIIWLLLHRTVIVCGFQKLAIFACFSVAPKPHILVLWKNMLRMNPVEWKSAYQYGKFHISGIVSWQLQSLLKTVSQLLFVSVHPRLGATGMHWTKIKKSFDLTKSSIA